MKLQQRITQITIEPNSWPTIREAIDRMMGEITDWDKITTDTKQ